MEYRVVDGPPFTWIDVVHPTREELLELAVRYGLHPTVVEDCLDPEHLPKFERLGDATFLIFRMHDNAAPDHASSIQELTRKVAIFYRPDFVLTVHRVELEEITHIRERFVDAPCTEAILLVAIANAVFESYDAPLKRAEATLDAFEAGLFDGGSPPSLQQAYNLKRRVSLTRRILWQTHNVTPKLVTPSGQPDPNFQDVRDSVEAYLFWADQLLEEVNLMLQIHLAMASHRTNDVMRILTAFSAFFLPLTFIVGVYGMNFDFMPELRNRWGYPAVMGLMLLVVLVIFIWFRRRGWLGGRVRGPR